MLTSLARYLFSLTKKELSKNRENAFRKCSIQRRAKYSNNKGEICNGYK